MYWELEKAIEELRRRQGNKILLRQVNEILGDCPVPAGQYGFLARHIASARLEDCQFEERCREVGLKPIFLTYPGDTFVSNNPDKLRLIQLFILLGYGKKGGPRLKKIYLLSQQDVRQIDGKVQLDHLLTHWGEPLVRFHHRARKIVGLKGEEVDMSTWLKSIGRAREYYKYFLVIFLTKGILFESFESPGFPNLDTFAQLVVFPAWRWIRVEFGCSPLIVRHPATNSPEEEKRILNWYPSTVLEAIPKEFVRGYL